LAPFIGDEAIRSLVAMEMMLSGNYFVPTLTGDFYFSKPPLYNWILILFFKLSGSVSELVPRMVTVIFSFLFTYLVYHFNRNRFQDKKYAILVAFMFLTCGRMIFYDSFLGLIDIFFSLVTYAMIILAYIYAEKKNYILLYSSVYFLSLVGFMLKGLPTLHFLGFTILIIHYIFGEWRKLLSKEHLLSMFAMLGAIFLYFMMYNQYMDATKTIAPLVDQATRRTIIRFGFSDLLKHFISYPIENLYHFFPWSVLGFLVFRKDILSKLKEDKYIKYLTLVFTANYIIYWISPEVYPRYILMLIPLAFTVWIYLYTFEVGKQNMRMKIVSVLFIAITIIVPILILYNNNHPGLKYVNNYKFYLYTLVGLLTSMSILYIKDKANRPILFVIYILILRIGMNVLVFPVRAETGDDEFYKRESIRVAQQYGPLKLYGKSKINHITAFYISSNTKAITNRSNDLSHTKFFIIDSTYINYFTKIDSFPDASHCGTRWIVKGEK
jgi:4-amino-4-deoxy-L-arabinose transferase-like glycosyltransferase